MKTKRLLLSLFTAVGCLWAARGFSLPAGDFVRVNNFQDHGCHNTPEGAGGAPSDSDHPGGNNSTCHTCNGATDSDATGIPEWWVDEPYINLHVVDEPLSYTTSYGAKIPFRFYYKQRYMWPKVDQIPSLIYASQGRDQAYGMSYYYYGMRCYGGTNASTTGMTNAAWAHSWMMDMMYWDARWESEAQINGPGTYSAPFGNEYEALLFHPEGDITYFATGSAQPANAATLTNNPSQTTLTFYPYNYAYFPSVTNLNPDPLHIYYGFTNYSIALSYPDGSQDVFNLVYQPFSSTGGTFYHGSYNSTSHALLTQRIDPQGRKTYIGYEKFTNSGSAFYRVHCVVDPDRRTNFFNYANSTTFNLQSIQDPFGRSLSISYNSSNWISGITDAIGTNNTFSYTFRSPSGWLSSMTTPYGTTSFSYASTPETGTGYPADAFSNMVTLVNEPAGASQLFAYIQDTSGLVEQTNVAPSVPGESFDSGVHGDGQQALYYRNSFHWDRKQFSDLSFDFNNPATEMGYLGAADLRKATMSHWLLASDGVSLTEEISSVRDPSPDPTGGTEGQWTWYTYNDSVLEDEESTSQVEAIARLLPDGTSQYTRYKYPVYPASPWVSENDQSYSKPGGSVAELTNSFTYAANGIDLVSQSNNFGQHIGMSYNSSHEVTAATNAVGQVAFFGYTGTTLTSMTLPSGQTFGFSYNSSTNPALANWLNQVTVSPENLTETITNWTYGLAQYVQVAGTGLPTLLVSNSWDALNRLTGTVYQDATTISNIYAARDLIRHKDRAGNWTSASFDALDHLVGFTNALGHSMSFNWCGCGSLTSLTDFTGTNTTYFNLDNQARVTNVVFPDNSSYTNQYDLLGRVTNRIDGVGNFLEYRYNNQNLITNIAGAYGAVWAATYDPLNRPTNIVDANGVIHTNTYDLLNELTARAWTGGAETFLYASNGLIAYTNQDRQGTLFGRDFAGRLTSVTNALQQVTRFTYNALDQPMGLTDGNGHTTQWGYNQWGWLTNKTNALSAIIEQWAYDPDGRVTTRTLAGTNTSYTYDAAGNLTAILYPATSNTFIYDADNRLQSASNIFGVTTFGYSGAGQLTVESDPVGTLNYTYNQGRRATLTLGNWTQTYNYDNAWRLQTILSPIGSFAYSYAATPSPLPSGLQLPNGAAITYGYDTLARLTNTALANYWGQIVDAEGCGRDPLGLPTNIVRNLGMTANNITPAYDAINEVTGWSASESGTNRLNEQLKYQYDPAGNLITRTNNALVQTFTPNSLNEISTVTRSGTFTLTGALPEPANSISVNSTAATQYADLTFAAPGLALANGANTFTTVAANRYSLQITNATAANLPSTVTFAYDANGNLTNDGLRAFQYDAENQLTNVYITGQWQTVFIYDALNRRRVESNSVWQSGAWVVTNTTRFLYDGAVPLAELNSTNGLLVTYSRGLDLSLSLSGPGGIGGLLARTDSNGPAFYHSDLNGSVTTLMDQYQHVVARYEYDPFGKLIGQWGANATANRYLFSSKERILPANLYYYGARFYDPALQRWLNRDPIQELGGPNLYGFVGNSPLTQVDPTGLFFQDFFNWAGKGIYDYMMGDPSPPDPNSQGALQAAALGGIDPHDNALRDAFGQAAGFLGDQATDYAAGKVAAAAAGPILCKAGKAIGKALSKAPTVEQYALRAVESGHYPVMFRTSDDPVFTTYLEKGDVWKFGTTQNPALRYSQSYLDSVGSYGVQYSTEFSGTEQQALQLQNMKIENYQLQNGKLPPGNKIVN